MIKSEDLRYWIGKSASHIMDMAVACKATPARLPVGLHLEFDLQRFLDQPVVQIIDAGANVGNTAFRFARYFINATIHAFEPVEGTFNRLQERTKTCPRIVCRKLALGEKESSLPIALFSDSERNSLLNEEASSQASGSEMVRVVCLDQYAEREGLKTIDLLKLDLEGYELQALNGAQALMNKGLIRAVYAECGFVKTDTCKTSFNSLHEKLTANGFQFSGFYQNFRWGPNKRWMGFSNGLWLRG